MNTNPLAYLFRETWKYSDGRRRHIVAYSVLFILAVIIEMTAQPFLMAKIMSVLEKESITAENIRFLITLLFLPVVADLVYWVFHGPARCLQRNNAFWVRANYRKFLLQGLLTLPLEWHTNHHTGETLDKIEKGTTGLFSFAEDCHEGIYALGQLAISIIILARFSWPSAFLVALFLFSSIWVTTRFDKVLLKQQKELNKTENKIAESIADILPRISTVFTMRMEKFVFEAIMKKVEEPFELFRYNQYLNEWKWCLANAMCSFMTASVLIVYVVMYLLSHRHVTVTEGATLIAIFYLLTRYLDRISNLFFHFAYRYGDVMKWATRLWNAEEMVADFQPKSMTNHVLPRNWDRIGIADLQFSYDEESNHPHLEDISLSIHRGERIALVGERGSGKTTLLKLIRDLHHPQKLDLTVDGQIIPEGFAGIERAICLSLQQQDIFSSTTIRGNIQIGAEYSEEHIARALELACFSEVVSGLPEGLETLLSENGANFSPGQRQCLALARSIAASLHDPDKTILLFDEPISSLDAMNGARVYENIFSAFQDRTLIISEHRLHLLTKFDTIYVFDKGRIVGRGSVKTLLQDCSIFRTMWNRDQEHTTVLS